MSGLRMIYLFLAIVGAIVPMYFFLTWFIANHWSLSAMVQAWNVNAASSGLVWDLTIAAIALTVWILAESWVRRDWLSLVCIPATWLIGVSCGLPLFLFLRGRPIA